MSSTAERGLKRGLDALIQETRGLSLSASEIQKVPTSSLVPNAQQPRRSFPSGQLEELAASIKNQGVLQPVLVRPISGRMPQQYEIVAGERRWRASTIAGLAEIPVIIKELSDQDTLVVALMENLQRADLTPLEESHGLQRLREEFGLSQDDLAQRLGKSRSGIANALRLLSLSDAARADLTEGRISAGHARALLAVTDAAAQETLRCHIIAAKMNVREAESHAAAWKERGEFPMPDVAGVPGFRRTGTAKNVQSDKKITHLAQSIGARLALPVSIRGGSEKGSIRISYASSEELAQFLQRLGISEGKI